jgi:uroporphyrin-3 C-methyltransferase
MIEQPRRRWPIVAAVLLVLAVAASLALGWSAQQRVKKLESELVRRQQDSQSAANEARLFGKRAEESARESAAKVALLEARLAEVAVQRTQLEELIQSMSRSRDENMLVDIEAGLRVAQQQATLTGSAEPLLTALKAADERLQRQSQPRLEGVRRAIARDVERVKAVGVPDISALTLRLDEAIRLVDELPLLSQAETRKEAARPAVAANSGRAASAPVAASAAASTPAMDDWNGWWKRFTAAWSAAGDEVWGEVRSLVRVTRIDHPDAMLLAPEQAFFLRENLKLRLLNARLALLSRQFDTVQSDLQQSQGALERHFDRSSRRTTTTIEAIKQVIATARQVGLPRPDDTLAALAAAGAGR